MLHAKLRGVSLGASHAGVCNYHLSITARIALRRAPPTVYSTGRSRDYRRVKSQMVQKGKDLVSRPGPMPYYLWEVLLKVIGPFTTSR